MMKEGLVDATIGSAHREILPQVLRPLGRFYLPLD